MKLVLKFNLVFLAVFIAGIALAGLVSRDLLRRNAEAEVVDRGRLLMEAAAAVSSYTGKEIAPLLETQMKYSFLPQSVPSFSSLEVLATLQKSYPDYAFKSAMLNPTNPADRAADWELDVVGQFSKSADMQEFVGQRDTPAGRSLYLAKPIRISDPACLVCHTSPEMAPKTLVDRYGPSNGFGWKLNEVLGARVVSVPMKVALENADRAFERVMLMLVVAFLAVGVVLNFMLWQLVIRPVTRLSAAADQVSRGDLEAGDFAPSARDEIGALAEAFGRMRKSLVHAMRLLEG